MTTRKSLAATWAMMTLLSAFALLPVQSHAQTPPAAQPATGISVSAAPRSYIVVSVPVPAEFGGAPVSYQIEPANAVSLLGRASGTVRDGDSARTALITLGVPARARAGRMVGAIVSFTAAGATVKVPVEIVVTPVHGLALETRDLAAVRAGTRIILPYTVRNEGNTPDSVLVRLTLPDGWHSPDSQREHVAVLEAGATEERAVRISVPRGSATGSFFVQFEAATASLRTSGSAAVEVVGDETTALAGPSFTASVAAVAGGGAETASVFSAALSGPLTSSVSVNGHFALASTDEPIATRGFTRVGTFANAPRLAVWAPDWRLSAGNTAVGYSDLTGTNAWGNALSGSYTYGSHSLSGVAAPRARFNDGTELYGASYRLQPGRFSITGTAMRLSEQHYSARELSAVGLGLGVDSLPLGTSLTGEIAHREYLQGAGLGYSAQLRNESRDGRLQLRYLHAPGGSAAFARAQEEWSASASRRLLPQWEVSAGYFTASDSNATLAAMRSRALSFNQQYHLDPALSLTMGARVSMFSANAAAANVGFGNDEQSVTAGFTMRRGTFGYGAEAGLESVTRTTDLGNGLSSELSGRRGVVRATAERVTVNGMLQTEGAYQHSAASNLLPAMFTLAARATQVRLALPPGDVFFNGETLYQNWGGGRNSNVILRGGLTVPLPTGFELSSHVEYNTLFSTASARSPLVFALKLERALHLPRLRTSSSSGYIFQDLNNNGVREFDEPGVPNVMVRQGPARAVTGRDGRYEFWERGRGNLTIETSSLPAGLVPGPHNAGAAARGDMPLVSTASVVITFAADLQNTRNRQADLARIVVLARDQQGREWLARRASETRALFDALPPGDYRLEFDFAALPEPLRTQAPVTFRVDGRSTVHLNVPLVGRPIRMFHAPNSDTNNEGGTK